MMGKWRLNLFLNVIPVDDLRQSIAVGTDNISRPWNTPFLAELMESDKSSLLSVDCF